MTIIELKGIRKQFEYYRMLADKTILLLSQDELNSRVNEESNSIAVIMRHITGNLLSRFIDFFTTDGEKEWRKRDDEFEYKHYDRHELISNWDIAWNVLFTAIDSIDETNIDSVVKIRNQDHTVAEALYRQLAHYPYHIGQIVFIGKMIKDKDWKSLSIPKNQSSEYNLGKFNNPNSESHFTDNYLNK
ncbi:DUF1572 family protein [Myroides injenensis]|uniref:DUF1572 family protein n=1 Tax=Myroides injenensis TaxID=1183151 RepID=UPI00028840C5|nr:DUF1572 family protein [Myroides injenensis]